MGGLATVIQVALRAIDYDEGEAAAASAFKYLQGLLHRIQPYAAEAKALGWETDTTDLAIYPALLGLQPDHDCYGSSLKIFVYKIHDMTRGVVHCQAGQW